MKSPQLFFSQSCQVSGWQSCSFPQHSEKMWRATDQKVDWCWWLAAHLYSSRYMSTIQPRWMLFTWHDDSFVEPPGWKRSQMVFHGPSSADAGQSHSWTWCTWHKIRWLCQGSEALFRCWAPGWGWNQGSSHPPCCVFPELAESPEACGPGWSAVCSCRHFHHCYIPHWPWWCTSLQPACCRLAWKMKNLGSLAGRASWGLGGKSYSRSWKDSKRMRTWRSRRNPLLRYEESLRGIWVWVWQERAEGWRDPPSLNCWTQRTTHWSGLHVSSCWSSHCLCVTMRAS